MEIKFEILSLDTIKSKLGQIRLRNPEQMRRISPRAENITKYGIDIYVKQMI